MVSTRTNAILKPSLRGSKDQRPPAAEDGSVCDLLAVQELQDSESSICTIVFGQERLHLGFILLATGARNGTVVIYRIPRSKMEREMFEQTSEAQQAMAGRIINNVAEDESVVEVHSRLEGHTRAVTSIFFSPMEDNLVSTSIDRQVRFWNVDTGELVRVFTDSSPVPCGLCMPFDPQNFVVANSNAVLRIVNIQHGGILQKLKVESEVRAMTFDESGLFLFAGTKIGSIIVLEAVKTSEFTHSLQFKFTFKSHLDPKIMEQPVCGKHCTQCKMSWPSHYNGCPQCIIPLSTDTNPNGLFSRPPLMGSITNIVFVPEHGGNPPAVFVNSSDSHVYILDVVYEGQQLTDLSVRHRVKVPHSLLPLKCCFSPGPDADHGGFLVSPAEDKHVYIFDLTKGADFKMQHLEPHDCPIVVVACNFQNTLLVSADASGRMNLWRRIDYSNGQDQNATVGVPALAHEAIKN
eukprot:gene1020-572_t